MTFGSPKVGNADFAETFSAFVGRSYRVVNQEDEARLPHAFVLSFQLLLCHISGGLSRVLYPAQLSLQINVLKLNLVDIILV